MQRLLLLVPLLALPLTACTEAPTAPEMAPQFSAARANPYTSDWWEVSGTWGTPPCTGEQISVQGKVHQITRQRGDQWEWSSNWAGVKGVGQTTGTRYVAQANDRGSVVEISIPSGWAPNFPDLFGSQDIAITQQMISMGSTDNFFVRLHVTYTYTVYFLGTYDAWGNPQYGVKDFVSILNRYTTGCTG